MGLGGLEVLGFYNLGQRLGFRLGAGLGFRDRIPVDEAKGYRFHHSGREFVRFFRLQVEPVFAGNKCVIFSLKTCQWAAMFSGTMFAVLGFGVQDFNHLG